MNYKEQLRKAKENAIDVISLSFAYEFECILDTDELSDDDFENLCGYVEYCYLKSDINDINAFCRCAVNLLRDEDEPMSVEEITDMGAWDFIEKVSWYL